MEQIINLKKFRKQLNITQTQEANKIGIDQRQWNRYENGINEMPLRYLKEICIKFKVSADWILELNQEEK